MSSLGIHSSGTGVSSPSTFFRLQGVSTSIQILSALRIGAGLGSFIVPGLVAQKVYGFSTRQTTGAGATANNTTAKPGAPEETVNALRLAGTRDIVLGLLLRDSTSVVVERALEIGLISSILDLVVTGYSFFIEGSISPETATASGLVAAIGTAFQYYIRSS